MLTEGDVQIKYGEDVTWVADEGASLVTSFPVGNRIENLAINDVDGPLIVGSDKWSPGEASVNFHILRQQGDVFTVAWLVGVARIIDMSLLKHRSLA